MINAEWHQANRMPRNATFEQRVTWHLEHLEHCACRPDLPPSVAAEVERRRAAERPTTPPAARDLMSRELPERDWKVFRGLRDVALDRLCALALREATAIIESSAGTRHERFLALCSLVADRNDDIARGFDGPKRSAMILQLSFMVRLGLLETHELARFSDETRDRLQSIG